MKIGIIGAGNIGTSLARRFTDLGHGVEIANSRGPQTLDAVGTATGATPTTVSEALRGKDVILVAIPMHRILDLPPDLLRGLPDDVVVIDANNYVPQQRDGRIDELENGLLESRLVARILGRPVVKAFNNILASHIVSEARPRGAAGRIALPISGDEHRPKSLVMELVDELGFDPVDVGGLDESWRHQPGSPVYGTDLPVGGLQAALAAASPNRPAAYSANR